ncbi:hypothetical protein P8452_66761 [Trifolium repens]|nr:hypothetical protein QL285_088557 [Trifolium repens]WJX84157.1 hypothetical protein P8452_66761 [Trifolium repens]
MLENEREKERKNYHQMLQASEMALKKEIEMLQASEMALKKEVEMLQASEMALKKEVKGDTKTIQVLERIVEALDAAFALWKVDA